MTFEDKAVIVISQLRADRDRLQNAIDKIRAEIAEYKDNKIIHAERNEMIDIVLEIIDKYRGQEPKTGHWTTEWSDIDREERHYCSECGKWEYTTSKYCPNCGFRMVGEEV